MRILPALAILSLLACTPRDDEADDTMTVSMDTAATADTGASSRPPAPDTGAPAPDPVAVVPGPSFRLVGNEPFWSVQIDSTRIRYITPEDSAGERFPAAKPVQMGDTLRWVSSNPRTILEANVVTGACSDGMSDRTWTHKAWVQVGDRKLTGCAEQR
jgi:uncharacterized membrane protein